MNKIELAGVLLTFIRSLEEDLGDKGILDDPVSYISNWIDRHETTDFSSMFDDEELL